MQTEDKELASAFKKVRSIAKNDRSGMKISFEGIGFSVHCAFYEAKQHSETKLLSYFHINEFDFNAKVDERK